MMTGKVLSAIMNKIPPGIREIDCVTLFEIDIFATRHPGRKTFLFQFSRITSKFNGVKPQTLILF